MRRHAPRARGFAILLSAVAGYVDAVGFLSGRSFFVSFMSGNTTRLAVGLAGWTGDALRAGGLIGVFVLGVVAGMLVGRGRDAHRAAAVLGFVALLLAGAALSGGLGATVLAMGLMALAMGAENAVFQRDGEVSIGLTYMTGTLVKLGQGLAQAICGGERWGWIPYLLLWSGLLGGATAGAVIYGRLGQSALWPAAVSVAVLAIIALRFDPASAEA